MQVDLERFAVGEQKNKYVLRRILAVDFKGVDKELDRNKLPEGSATDTANAYFHEGRIGTIGQRKGKTFASTTAYPNTVYGVAKLLLPHNTVKWVVSNNDGDAIKEDAPDVNPTVPTPGASIQLFTFDALNPSVSYPSGSTEVKTDLHAPIPAGTYELMVPMTYAQSVTWTGGTQLGNTGVNIRLLDASNNQLADVELEDYDNMKASHVRPAAGSSQVRKASITLSDVATQVQIRYVVTGGSGVTNYSGTCGPFYFITVR